MIPAAELGKLSKKSCFFYDNWYFETIIWTLGLHMATGLITVFRAFQWNTVVDILCFFKDKIHQEFFQKLPIQNQVNQEKEKTSSRMGEYICKREI